MTDATERLRQLQSEEMALRNLLDNVSEFSRGEIEYLLEMVREEIEHERARLKGKTQSA